MKILTPVVLLFAGCSAPDKEVDTESNADTAWMELGRVEGVVKRTAELTGDGVGNLIVTAFFATTPASNQQPHNGIAVLNVDFSDPDAEVSFVLENFFPEPEPYYFLAVFDEDNSLMKDFTWHPSAGDLLSGPVDSGEGEPHWIASGEVLSLSLELSEVAD